MSPEANDAQDSRHNEMPEKQRVALRKAIKLEWATIAWVLFSIVLVGGVLGAGHREPDISWGYMKGKNDSRINERPDTGSAYLTMDREGCASLDHVGLRGLGTVYIVLGYLPAS